MKYLLSLYLAVLCALVTVAAATDQIDDEMVSLSSNDPKVPLFRWKDVDGKPIESIVPEGLKRYEGKRRSRLAFEVEAAGGVAEIGVGDVSQLPRKASNEAKVTETFHREFFLPGAQVSVARLPEAFEEGNFVFEFNPTIEFKDYEAPEVLFDICGALVILRIDEVGEGDRVSFKLFSLDIEGVREVPLARIHSRIGKPLNLSLIVELDYEGGTWSVNSGSRKRIEFPLGDSGSGVREIRVEPISGIRYISMKELFLFKEVPKFNARERSKMAAEAVRMLKAPPNP